MTIRIVRPGSQRVKGEGTRIGTIHRPPRGMPKAEFTSQNWYDMWFPNLGPNVETMKLGQDAMTPVQWAKFIKKYRAEMAIPENSHVIELLAALSCQSNFSVGCYFENEVHCHRSVLRELLVGELHEHRGARKRAGFRFRPEGSVSSFTGSTLRSKWRFCAHEL